MFLGICKCFGGVGYNMWPLFQDQIWGIYDKGLVSLLLSLERVLKVEQFTSNY